MRSILEADKSCYAALVFAGVAAANLGEFEQSHRMFRKAIETDPNQITAWQGIVDLSNKQLASEEEYTGTSELADLQAKLNAARSKIDALYREVQAANKERLCLRFSIIVTNRATVPRRNAALLNEATKHLADETANMEKYQRMLEEAQHKPIELNAKQARSRRADALLHIVNFAAKERSVVSPVLLTGGMLTAGGCARPGIRCCYATR